MSSFYILSYVQNLLLKGFHTTYGNITTGGDEVEEEAAEPATNDEVVPEPADEEDEVLVLAEPTTLADTPAEDVAEEKAEAAEEVAEGKAEVAEEVAEEKSDEILADSAAFSNNNVLAAATMAMGFAAALLL